MVLDDALASVILGFALFGALAQLGERMAGSHEVRGSIPLGSTITGLAEPCTVTPEALQLRFGFKESAGHFDRLNRF